MSSKMGTDDKIYNTFPRDRVHKQTLDRLENFRTSAIDWHLSDSLASSINSSKSS